jgi:hypothetical protein
MSVLEDIFDLVGTGPDGLMADCVSSDGVEDEEPATDSSAQSQNSTVIIPEN